MTFFDQTYFLTISSVCHSKSTMFVYAKGQYEHAREILGKFLFRFRFDLQLTNPGHEREVGNKQNGGSNVNKLKSGNQTSKAFCFVLTISIRYFIHLVFTNLYLLTREAIQQIG